MERKTFLLMTIAAVVSKLCPIKLNPKVGIDPAFQTDQSVICTIDKEGAVTSLKELPPTGGYWVLPDFAKEFANKLRQLEDHGLISR